MSQIYLGSMLLVAFDFAPVGFALCQGQLLPIAQNTALFSLLGTQYGGDGRTTFGLPDLRGNVPIGQGQGPGLSPYSVGDKGGVATVTLQNTLVPPHQHSVLGAKGSGNAPSPAGHALAQSQIYATAGGASAMNSAALGPNIGGGQAHNNFMPYQTLNWIIALQGVFPPRN